MGSGPQETIDLILPYGVDINKSVLATIMGEHERQLIATELLNVNKGLGGLLRLEIRYTDVQLYTV